MGLRRLRCLGHFGSRWAHYKDLAHHIGGLTDPPCGQTCRSRIRRQARLLFDVLTQSKRVRFQESALMFWHRFCHDGSFVADTCETFSLPRVLPCALFEHVRV
jgi:hypothetical protein